MALAPTDLIGADDEEVVEALGVESGRHHPLDDPSGRVPVDAHQATQRGLVHGGREPADQVLEVAGEVRVRSSEGDPLGARPVGGALDPAQGGAPRGATDRGPDGATTRAPDECRSEPWW